MRQAAAEADQATGVIPPAPWRVKALSIMADYRLAVTFQDGTSGIADLSALTTATNCGIYEALKDPTVFGQARPELGVVTWPNGADIDPAWMYEQLKYMKTWSVPIELRLAWRWAGIAKPAIEQPLLLAYCQVLPNGRRTPWRAFFTLGDA